MSVTIYHNPRCSKSRETLALLTEKGIEPQVIEYLKTPYTHEQLTSLLDTLGMAPRELMRTSGEPYTGLGLADPALSTEQLVDAMVREPSLVNRPVVVTPKGARLCRPPELVNEIL